MDWWGGVILAFYFKRKIRITGTLSDSVPRKSRESWSHYIRLMSKSWTFMVTAIQLQTCGQNIRKKLRITHGLAVLAESYSLNFIFHKEFKNK